MKKICLITHTEATHTVNNLVGGWYDSELTEVGRKQANALSSRVAEYGFDIATAQVYSSDLTRAKQTAEIICGVHSNRIIFDARLREMSFGDNEGLPQSEHSKLMQFPPKTGNRLDHRICKGAESPRELASRVTEFVESIMQDEQDVIVIAHGFSSSFVIAAFQQIPIEGMAYIDYKLRSASISILEVDDYFHNHAIKLLNA